VCKRVEKHKHLNTHHHNLSCDDVILQQTDIDELRWLIKWYNKALQTKGYNWDQYNKYYSQKKKKNYKSSILHEYRMGYHNRNVRKIHLNP